MTLTYIRHIPAPPLNAYIDYFFYLDGLMTYPREKSLPVPTAVLIINFGGAIHVSAANQPQVGSSWSGSWWMGPWSISHIVEWSPQVKQKGISMRTVGSLSLCRSLLNAGLVDRFRVVVFPVINGKTGYDRIYDGYPDVALELVKSQTFDGRLQLLEYAPRVVDKTVGAQADS